MSTIIITGGGTGGHLKVAEVFMQELYERGHKLIYIGSTNGQDKKWFEHQDKFDKKFFLESKGVVNKGFFGKIKALFQIAKLTLKCRAIIKQNNVTKVICVGGYSAAAATFASIITKNCKLYIHEQNSHIGKLNQISSKFATEFFSSYLYSSKIKDYPVDLKFFQNARIRKEVKTVIFLGGSQGAKGINEFALKVATRLKELGINIIHQTGKDEFCKVKQNYDDMNIKADVFDFCNNIEQKMQKADFAISRAGASTLWELSANGLPTLYVPYPLAAGNHQFFNAKFLVDKKLAFLKKQNELDENYFFECLNEDLQTISKELINIIKKNGIKEIVDVILEEK